MLALAGAAWVLYGSVLQLWWTHDDFFLLRALLTRRPYWYFVSASDYHEMPPGLLTPLLFFSLDADRRLFGIDPHPFYLHQLAAVSLCIAVLYGVARLWLSRVWAAVAAWIFLVGPVTASMASLVMVRHYVEATTLALLSIAAWAGALRQCLGAAAWRRACLSAALYFAACVTKEIAVPLVALLPLLPSPDRRGGFRERVRLALPHVVAVAVYLALRYAVLGTLFGAYGFAVRPSDLPALGLELPGKIAREFVGGHLSSAAVGFALALAAGVATIFIASSGRRAAAFALLLAMLPVLPVSTRMEPRYAMPAWIVVAVAFALGCRTLAAAENRARWRNAAVVIAVVACASGLWLNRQDWRVRFATLERMSAENRFVLEMKEGDVLRQPLTLAASLLELTAVFQRPHGGRWFQDDLFLCLHGDPLGRVWGYDPAARRVIDLTKRIPDLRDGHCASIRADAPLRARFHVAGHDLFWELGPYRSGTYRFVLDDGGSVFEMPRSGGFQMRGRPALPALRVGYESPEGWVTYSPAFQLGFVDGWTLAWSR